MSKTMVVELKGLRVFAHHGVFEHERQNGQDFFIDAKVWVANSELTTKADLERTVNYGELAKALSENVRGEPVDLLETLAQRLLVLVLNWGGDQGPVVKAKITVHKPDAPIEIPFSDVSVTVKGKRKKASKND
jgi:dihydroneopterin aldolase